MSEHWPLVLRDRELELRPLRRGDRRAYAALRERNREWLQPWEATDPDPARPRPAYPQMLRWMAGAARQGSMIPLAMVADRRLVGQITAGPIQYGPGSGASIGYWIDHRQAGRGLTPRALALLMDHLFTARNLHRVELAIRPENRASIRVAQKLHLREEGLRRSCIHVDGAWRDHRIFALCAEEITDPDDAGAGVLARLMQEMRSPGAS